MSAENKPNAVISGAREGRASGLRRLLARAATRDLSALVVPGREVARAAGLDLESAGLSLAAGPRQASVLVVVGRSEGLPEPLERAAEVAYAQIPRPRATLVVGEASFDSLPADVRCDPEQTSLAAAVRQLRRAFQESAFATQTQDFEAPALETRTVYTCSMHPEVERVRSRGFAVSANEVIEGITSVGAPIRSRGTTDASVAVVTVGQPDTEALGAAVQRVARAIEADLR